MVTSTPSISAELIDRARQGEEEAWQILFDDCYPKIIRVIRRKMSRSLRTLYDSTDIANEVMNSLAVKFDQFDFTSIRGLRAYLITAAERKLVDGHRYGHAMKRDVSRNETSYSATEFAQAEFLDKGPSASQVAVATEREQSLLGNQSDDGRSILELKMQGYTNTEVAQTTGWHLRKIERFLERLRGTCRL